MALETKVILNVDDYDPSRYARNKVLAKAGFDVRDAATGRDALRIISEVHPHLVVLDVNLPDINGLEVCQRIRENPETSSTLVVHLSASAVGAHNLVRGLQNGADSYLTEPIAPEVLVATINALIRARSAEDALRRSNRDLERFAFTMAHELNEPLRTMNCHLELLARKYPALVDEEARECIQFAVGAGARMRDFMDEVLRYSQAVNTDNTRFQPASMDVVLAQAVENLAQAISESGAEIGQDPLPVVAGNEINLVHLMQNLLGNAIKYRRAEPPRVRVSVQEGPHDWVFSVADNGQGIEPAYAERIFEMFKRLHGRDYPGTGIGLSLCKRIVEQHGGKIWVESTPGSGSIFFFTIPTSRSQTPAP